MTAMACHSSVRALADDCFGSFAPKPSSVLLGWCLGPNFENSHVMGMDGGPVFTQPLVNLAVSALQFITPQARRMITNPLLARLMLSVGGMRRRWRQEAFFKVFLFWKLC